LVEQAETLQDIRDYDSAKAALERLESGKRKGSTGVLTAIAKTLKLSLDDIVAS